MRERLPTNHNIALSTLRQYEGSTLNVDARALVMEKYSKPKIDMTAETIQSLKLAGLKPDHSVVDYGCAGGNWLLALQKDHGHTGPMVGIDDSDNSLMSGQDKASKEGLFNVSFTGMDVRYLTYPDNSFDAFSAQNLLYHVDDYEKALQEIVRTSKYGAPGIISTKGDFHQVRIWEAQSRFEPQLHPPVEGSPNLTSPENFYLPFDAQDAAEILESYFEIVPELSVNHSTVIVVPPEGWLDYRQAVLSLKDSYTPLPPKGGEIKNLVDGEFKEIFDREVAQKGYFVDYVQRVFFLCRNTKKTTS
jgi:SAM-dependent methyltransferase